MSWSFQILPYLEEGAIYGIATSQQDLKQATIAIYVCPSRRPPRTSFDVSLNELYSTIDYAAAVPGIRVAPMSATNTIKYNFDSTNFQPFTINTLNTFVKVFNGGTVWPPADKFPGDNVVYEGVIVRTPWRWTGYDMATKKVLGNPVKNAPTATKFAKIVDGTSNTFMIAEKFVRSDQYEDTAALHYSDDRGWSDGWDADTMRLTGFLPINDSDSVAFQGGPLETYFSDAGQVGNQVYNCYHFGSPHTSGINAVFVDGSVHTLSFNIDLTLFNSLATRSGDETLDKTGIN
jgi:prepilin-type processing-associated H-X9-DG protein